MSQKLENIKQSMKDFQQTYSEDVCLVLGDNEGVLLGYLPGRTIDIGVSVGDKILESSVTIRSLREGRPLREENDSSAFGFPYISLAQPIFNGREVIGVLSALVSLERVSLLREGATELAAAVQQMSAMTEEMTVASSDVTNQIQELSKQTESIRDDISEIMNILTVFKDISRQSNILGINASIEAARAGDHGRGFSVVAQEIRRMADDSNENAVKIDKQLDVIERAINHISLSTDQIVAFTEEHNASMGELSATYSRLGKTADELLQASSIEN